MNFMVPLLCSSALQSGVSWVLSFGRVYLSEIVSKFRCRDSETRWIGGVTMTCCRGDGVPADASPGLDAIDATLHTNHGRKRNSTQVE